MEYYTMTTNAGDQAIAHAIQTGTTTTFKQIAVGDGNGTYYEPAKTQTVLRREVWRGNAVVSLDANNPKRVIVTATIPATTGGFTIREAGIFDTANAMMVVSKLPLSEKVAPESGASSDLVIRLYVEVSDAGAVNITVDPSAVMATKGDINNAVTPIGNALSAHIGNSDIHPTKVKQDSWDAGIVSTYIHTKNGTVHNLAGTGNNIEFLAKAEISDGDTWTVNGTAVAATLQNGDPLPADLFKSGSWVTGVRLDGAKLGFKSAGGSIKYNVFCQPSEPPTKQGIWLKTAAVEAIKKIVFDTQPFAAGSWKVPSGVKNLPACFSTACGFVYGNEAFLFGGNNYNSSISTVTAYNPTTDSYRYPLALTQNRERACGAQYNGEFFIFGGRNDTSPYTLKTAVAYNPVTNTYRALADMPEVRMDASCATIGDEIFIFSGFTASGYSSSAIAYKPATNTYRSIASMPEIRYTSCCVAFGDEIFHFGGQNASNYPMGSAVAYKPSTNTYRSIANMTYSRYSNSGVIVSDEIFILGGPQSGSALHTTLAYKPATNTYRFLADMPNAHNRNYAAVLGSTLFYFGGIQSNGFPGGACESMALTAKQYPDNPTAVIQYLPGDASHVASLIASKLCDYLPSYFKNAMLFKDGNLLYPELYTGDGTAWTKIREAQ